MKRHISIESVKSEFLEWREQKKHRDRIPEELWQKSVSLLSRHSVSEISKYFNISYDKLKEKAGIPPARRKNPPEFVEVMPDSIQKMLGRESAVTVKIQNENGESLEIFCPNANVEAICEVFLRGGRTCCR